MHTSLCNESLNLKVGTIQIRQLFRLYPGSWLEAGSISVPELRINAKFECQPPTPAAINEQLEFLLTNSNILSCARRGGSTNYYTLIQGEQFFKSSFRLSEQSSFGCSLFHPDVHVLHSHFIFEHKYYWTNYEHVNHLRRRSDDYLTSSQHLSLTSASQTSLTSTLNNNTNNIMESSSISSLTMMQQQSSTLSSPMYSDLNLFLISIDSLITLEEILQRQQTRNSLTFLPQKGTSSDMEYNTVPQPSLPSSSWISLRNQMEMSIPKSTLLCTIYIRYLSHYRSSTWSNIATFPPNTQQDQNEHRPILDFNCVSQVICYSIISTTTISPTTTSNCRPCLSIAQTMSPSNTSNIIATEREVCLQFIGAFNFLLTPLMLECLTTYIEKWKTYDIHPISILDIPKISVCLLPAALVEDNLQLTELCTPVDIFTMSLFALSSGVFKIQSITGQLRRFENDFSSVEHVNIHADGMRHVEPTINVNNTNGYKRLSIGHAESDFEDNTSGIRFNDNNHDNETTYYTDIIREYAGVEIYLFHH
ncbi:unnamed protein product [Adineta steineri]|uniref:Uncharacterized protein n=1 Tax=Adineta steineri TaxID=433720 RepID=A0A815KN62_9BILA|nr:unnamed protein product [Adineta steineri]